MYKALNPPGMASGSHCFLKPPLVSLKICLKLSFTEFHLLAGWVSNSHLACWSDKMGPVRVSASWDSCENSNKLIMQSIWPCLAQDASSVSPGEQKASLWSLQWRGLSFFQNPGLSTSYKSLGAGQERNGQCGHDPIRKFQFPSMNEWIEERASHTPQAIACPCVETEHVWFSEEAWLTSPRGFFTFRVQTNCCFLINRAPTTLLSVFSWIYFLFNPFSFSHPVYLQAVIFQAFPQGVG